MTREGALLVTVAATLLLIAVLVFAWWRRTRRDAALVAPASDLPAGTPLRAGFTGFYVATTAHDQPLERLAVRGLGFRSRVDVAVADAGIALDLGATRILIPRDRLVAVGQSTVAIDRVVEPEGLVRLDWRIADDRVVDTYLRLQDTSARSAADAIRPLLPASEPASESASPGADA